MGSLQITYKFDYENEMFKHINNARISKEIVSSLIDFDNDLRSSYKHDTPCKLFHGLNVTEDDEKVIIERIRERIANTGVFEINDN